MALNIPLPDAPDVALGKAFTQGTSLYNTLMNQAYNRAKNKREDTMLPIDIKHKLAQISNANATNARAQGLYGLRLQKLKNELDPNYKLNEIARMADWANQQYGSQEEGKEQPEVNKDALREKLQAMGMFGGMKQPQEEMEQGQGMFPMQEEAQEIQEYPVEEPITEKKQTSLPKQYNPKQIAVGKMLEKAYGYNPFPEKKMTPLDLFIEKEKYKAEHPSAGSNTLHGTAAEVESHFKYLQQHPPGTPEGDEELKQWQLKNEAKNILNENRAENTKNAAKRVLTAEAKRAGELDQIEKGFNPATGEKLSLERQKQLKASYQSKEGNLGKGKQYIYDPDSDERIGIQRDLTEKERKEVAGRETFNEVLPIINKGLAEYGGSGSYVRFLNDTRNYGKESGATQRIDNFLLAKSLLTAGTIKEDATLGGANTNQVYNRLLKSLDSSDLKPIVEYIGTSINLPKTAKLKSGMALPKVLESITKKANQRVPAKIDEYFEPDKYEKIWVINNETGKKEQITRAEYNKHLEE